MRFVMASNNQKKLEELRNILSGFGIEAVSQLEAGLDVRVDETGGTFEENALLKARAVCEGAGLPAIADDSGIEADALGGDPGVRSARYGGETCSNDAERTALLLKNMENQTDRRGRFVSCIACVFPDGRTVTARGECEGEILYAPRGGGGFGYDPVFYVSECEMSMAEMPAELKNRISHRARALGEFQRKLAEILDGGETYIC